MRARRGSVWAAALLLGAAAPASAELFRCKGPDGRTIFTDQKRKCPTSEAYEPRGRVDRASDGVAAAEDAGASAGKDAGAAAARDRDALAAQAREAEAQRWRQKKSDAEEAIDAIRAERQDLRQYVTHCNRGGYVTTRDDAGIKQRVSCSSLKQRFGQLAEAEARARDYLENDLPEECRKAGCLPGWIR